MLTVLAHFFVPRVSNNHKARILHLPVLVLLVAILVCYQFSLKTMVITQPKGFILGYKANISVNEVIKLTNEERSKKGLPTLVENTVLSQAAEKKGLDMLAKGYWAHVAPDGTQPWKFFTEAGYSYRVAGENLARDFSNPMAAVEAWMASPTHRANILSAKYKEIGIGVVEGNLNGVDTTIVVQFFATKLSDKLPVVPVAKAQEATPAPTALALVSEVEEVKKDVSSISKSISSVFSGFDLGKAASIALIGTLIFVVAIDGLVIAKRGIVRLGGRSLAHFAFLGMILSLVILAKAGKII